MKVKRRKDNVIDSKLQFTERRLLALQSRIDDERLTDIDFSDITILKSAANESTQDEIVIGPKAAEQIMKSFSAFGFARMPATWGELQGTYDFCCFLRALWGGSRDTKYAEIVKRNALLTIESSFPEYLKHATYYMNNNLKSLTKIVSKTDLMKELGKEYKELEQRDAKYGMSKLL